MITDITSKTLHEKTGQVLDRLRRGERFRVLRDGELEALMVPAEEAWKALRSGERTHARLRWQSDLRAEFVIEAADELSAQTALASKAGSGDFLHVAAARRLHLLSGLDEFWTCDAEQGALASAAGLKLRRFELKTPPRASRR